MLGVWGFESGVLVWVLGDQAPMFIQFEPHIMDENLGIFMGPVMYLTT